MEAMHRLGFQIALPMFFAHSWFAGRGYPGSWLSWLYSGPGRGLGLLSMTGTEGVAEVGAGPECQVWWHPASCVLWPWPCAFWDVGMGPLPLGSLILWGRTSQMGAKFTYRALEKSDDLRRIQVLPAVVSRKPAFPPDVRTAGPIAPCALNLQCQGRVLAVVPGVRTC